MVEVKIFEGRHSKVIALPKHGILLKIFPPHLKSNAFKEIEILKRLNDLGIECIPKYYDSTTVYEFVVIVKEFIEGEYFSEFLEKADIRSIAIVLKKLLKCLKKLDDSNILLRELGSPRKNIVVRNLNPYIIDLERWKARGKQSNITKFLSFITKILLTESELKKKLEKVVDKNKINYITKQYKKIREINDIFSIFKI